MFRNRYPAVTVVGRTRKSRRRTYTIAETERRLVVSVTEVDSNANLIELAAVKTLSKLGVPVANVVDTFEDSGRRYLVQEFVNGTPLPEALISTDGIGSFRLGEIMGRLLQTIHSVPVGQFEGLPSAERSWWDWIRMLEPNLPLSEDLTVTEPDIAFVHNDFLPHNILLKPNGSEVAALIDFEWCFLGDPTWDVGYLKWWLDTDDYSHPQECWSGVQSAYDKSIDERLAEFYASLRRPEPSTW